MKLGTQIKFENGDMATVVYNSLIGIGIMWGLHNPDPADFEGTNGNMVGNCQAPEDFRWEPEAILRDPWDGCENHGFTAEQCVGDDYEITRYGLGSE